MLQRRMSENEHYTKDIQKSKMKSVRFGFVNCSGNSGSALKPATSHIPTPSFQRSFAAGSLPSPSCIRSASEHVPTPIPHHVLLSPPPKSSLKRSSTETLDTPESPLEPHIYRSPRLPRQLRMPLTVL